jgi:hypothetical protein
MTNRSARSESTSGRRLAVRWLGVGAAALIGCGGGDAGPGTLTVTVYGEEYIEEEIPASVFADGWQVSFDKFLVSLGEVTVADGEAAPAFDVAAYRIYDLTRPSAGAGVVVDSAEVAGGVYDRAGYRIAPAISASAANADAADVTWMVDEELSVHVEGSASKGAVTKTFAWSFAGATIHGDHLFYDDLVSTEPNVAFDVLAQADDDGDADGEITQAELETFALATLERYQVGSLDIEDLWHFVEFQTTTLGHIDGEGHCHTTVRE